MLFPFSDHEFDFIHESDVKFSDVVGIDEIVDELDEVKRFMELKKEFLERGAKLPKGILFHGPPGTGKTLIAKALAGEAN
jgi:cell division protease FtsH